MLSSGFFPNLTLLTIPPYAGMPWGPDIVVSSKHGPTHNAYCDEDLTSWTGDGPVSRNWHTSNVAARWTCQATRFTDATTFWKTFGKTGMTYCVVWILILLVETMNSICVPNPNKVNAGWLVHNFHDAKYAGREWRRIKQTYLSFQVNSTNVLGYQEAAEAYV